MDNGRTDPCETQCFRSASLPSRLLSSFLLASPCFAVCTRRQPTCCKHVQMCVYVSTLLLFAVSHASDPSHATRRIFADSKTDPLRQIQEETRIDNFLLRIVRGQRV